MGVRVKIRTKTIPGREIMINFNVSGVFPKDDFSSFGEGFEKIVWRSKFKPLFDGRNFSVSISCQEVGGLKILTSRVSPHHLRRDVKSEMDPPFAIAFKTCGKVIYRLGQIERSLENGDLIFIDTARAYELICPEKSFLTALVIPREDLRKRMPSAELMAGKILPARSGSSRIIANLMSSVFAHGGNSSGLSSQFLSSTLIEACQSAYDSAFQTSSRHSTAGHAFILNNILRYIDDNLAESEMTPSSIAANFRVSERQLYALMGEIGVTPAKYIWSKRFELSKQMLLSGHARGRTIGEIAYACGFNSPSHFSREFRSRFGMAPRDYRCSVQDMSSC